MVQTGIRYFPEIVMNTPPCPQCQCDYTYSDGQLFICPECGHEWSADAASTTAPERIWKDAHGNVLADGDSVTLIKDLKDFTATFFQKNTLLNILLTYSVFDTSDTLLIMRPYQIAATERILWKIRSSYEVKNWSKPESGRALRISA